MITSSVVCGINDCRKLLVEEWWFSLDNLTGTWVQDFFFLDYIKKMCIYNVYEPVWHASLWNKRLYELYPRCYPLEKIVSDDSWHIPGFLSTLSNSWTQKSLVAERLNGYSRVCFSQASWISTRDGSAFNFQGTQLFSQSEDFRVDWNKVKS